MACIPLLAGSASPASGDTKGRLLHVGAVDAELFFFLGAVILKEVSGRVQRVDRRLEVVMMCRFEDDTIA